MDFTIEQLAACTGATEANAAIYHPHLVAGMERFAINTVQRAAALFAMIGIESMHLTATEESLYYRDPARLAALYKRKFKSAQDAQPYVKNSAALSELLYRGYHGRGLGQITWDRNYQAASNALGYDYVSEPALVCQPEHAALTACWFFDYAQVGPAADDGDIGLVTERWNGPKRMHLAERTVLWERALQVLA